jgi:hypothetical protein
LLTERRSSTGPSSFVESFGAERDDFMRKLLQAAAAVKAVL